MTPPPGAARLHFAEPGLYDADAAWPRLLLALALSCMLHAAVIGLPFLGMSVPAGRFAPAARMASAPALEARLPGADVRDRSDTSASTAPVPDAPAPAADRTPDPSVPAARQRTEGADLLPLPAPVYYTTDQLSKRPQPLAIAELDAPQIRPIIASGKMVLKLWINAFGAVADVEVERTDLPEVFSRTAVEAFKALRFQPGERNGQAVATIMRIEVTYDDGRP